MCYTTQSTLQIYLLTRVEMHGVFKSVRARGPIFHMINVWLNNDRVTDCLRSTVCFSLSFPSYSSFTSDFSSRRLLSRYLFFFSRKVQKNIAKQKKKIKHNRKIVGWYFFLFITRAWWARLFILLLFVISPFSTSNIFMIALRKNP